MSEAPEIWRADKPSPQRIPDPSLASAFLMIALLDFDRNEKAPDLRAMQREGFDWRWHQREWHTREKARAIIEGRRRWPEDLRQWKWFFEVRYFHRGVGKIPSWCDPRNLTRPQREGLVQEEREYKRAAARIDGRARIFG